MPIRKEMKALYPKHWKKLSKFVKELAGWKCEFCGAAHKPPHPVTGSLVILTSAHLDQDPTNNHNSNFRALCQRCHNRHDAPHRARNPAKTLQKVKDKRNLALTFTEGTEEAESFPDGLKQP